MRPDDGVIMYIRLAALITIIIIIVSCGFSSVYAAPNHHVNIAATLCTASDGTLQLDGVAQSWAKEVKGQNSSVQIDIKVVYANNSVKQWLIADAPFQEPSYEFAFSYQGIPADARGQEMRTASLWTLYINGEVHEQGFVKLGADASTQLVFPGQSGKLRLTVEQAPGHPGGSLPQATIDTSECATPTNIDESAESITIESLGVEVDSDGQTWTRYYVRCTNVDSSSIIEMRIVRVDGVIQILRGTYCNSKVGIGGLVQSIQIVGVVANNATGNNVYLPLVTR